MDLRALIHRRMRTSCDNSYQIKSLQECLKKFKKRPTESRTQQTGPKRTPRNLLTSGQNGIPQMNNNE